MTITGDSIVEVQSATVLSWRDARRELATSTGDAASAAIILTTLHVGRLAGVENIHVAVFALRFVLTGASVFI